METTEQMERGKKDNLPFKQALMFPKSDKQNVTFGGMIKAPPSVGQLHTATVSP